MTHSAAYGGGEEVQGTANPIFNHITLRAWQKWWVLDATNNLVESGQSWSCLQHNQHVPIDQKWSPVAEHPHPPAESWLLPRSHLPSIETLRQIVHGHSIASVQSQSAHLKFLPLGYLDALSHWYDVAAPKGMQFPFYANNWDFRMYLSFQIGAKQRESTHLLPQSNAQMLCWIRSSV